MTVVFREINDWKKFRQQFSLLDKAIGFVPTMGALHQGHIALIETAKKENEIVVVSAYINPTQFDNSEDLKSYPQTHEADLMLLKQLEVDCLLSPGTQEMYPDHYHYKINEEVISRTLCGASRLGHFTGVLTIVMKFFLLVQPSRAYFGEKDYQQLCLVRKMAEAFFLNIEVRSIPTVRDTEGLAYSSRNQFLSRKGRLQAVYFAHVLRNSNDINSARDELRQQSIKIDYLEEIAGRRYAAVIIDGIRLIDNVQI